MLGGQKQVLEIMDKALDSFDRFRFSLLEKWDTINDPERIAVLIEQVSRQMIDILAIVERINMDNNRSWKDTIKAIAKIFGGIIAVGGAVAAAAHGRK